MDRGALARELFDVHQDMRDLVQALLLERDPEVQAVARKFGQLVERADKVVEGYVASMDSARVTVKG